MLVLTRKKNEQLVIGDLVTITIVEIRGDKVRIGIQAPREVSVDRREVYDGKKKERDENERKTKEAASSGGRQLPGDRQA